MSGAAVDGHPLTIRISRALRWRALGLATGVVLLPIAVASLVAGGLILWLATVALAIPFAWAAVYGTTLLTTLASDSSPGNPAAAALDIVREQLPAAQVISSKNGQLVLVPTAAAPHRIRISWRQPGEMRVEAEASFRGMLKRSVVLDRAGAWQSVVQALMARGYHIAK